MEKKEYRYLVKSERGTSLHIMAATSTQAKRIYCQIKGIKPNDYWCGVSTLTARKLKPKEIEEWEKESKELQETFLYIKGMMDVFVEANKK